MRASSGAGAMFGKDGGWQGRKVADAVEAAGPRGGVADATAVHPAGADATRTIPPILLLLATSAWGLTRLARREPGAVPGRREWPPIEPPDRGRE
jgi:hypothetical protein